MDLSILIIWMSPFLLLEVSGKCFYFHCFFFVVSNHCWLWSDAALCSIWTESTVVELSLHISPKQVSSLKVRRPDFLLLRFFGFFFSSFFFALVLAPIHKHISYILSWQFYIKKSSIAPLFQNGAIMKANPKKTHTTSYLQSLVFSHMARATLKLQWWKQCSR